MPGSTERLKRRWRSWSQRQSTLFFAEGARAAWTGGTRERVRGAILAVVSERDGRTHLGFRSFDAAFAGRGEPGASDASLRERRASGAHVIESVREGPPSRISVRVTEGCAVRTRAGGLSRYQAESLDSIRPIRARRLLTGSTRSGSSLRASSQDEARRQTTRGETSPRNRTSDSRPLLVPVRRYRVAEVVGPSSSSEKRAIGIVRVESSCDRVRCT